MVDWWDEGPARKARRVHAEELHGDRRRGAGSRLRNQRKRMGELIRAEERAEDAEALAAVAEQRLEQTKWRLGAAQVDRECSKQTNRRLFRDYENAVEEKRLLKRESEKLLDLVERLKKRLEKHQHSSSSASFSVVNIPEPTRCAARRRHGQARYSARRYT